MNETPENPPAFPQPMAASPETGSMYCAVEKHENFGGMTLRDYFAAKATEEDIQPYMVADRDPISGKRFPIPSREVAKFLYADAMLKARALQ